MTTGEGAKEKRQQAPEQRARGRLTRLRSRLLKLGEPSWAVLGDGTADFEDKVAAAEALERELELLAEALGSYFEARDEFTAVAGDESNREGR
jgi:hypothetical protein